MDKIFELLKQSPLVILIVALGYFGKVYVESEINSVNARVTEISKSSLSIKEDLRGEERQALIEFRIALERWEHFLFSSLTNFSTRKITNESINEFYGKESQLQLAVKEGIAKIGIIAQDEDIYTSTYTIIINISNTYNPLINKHLPVLIDLQAELEPIEYRMMMFEQSMKGGAEFEYTLEQAKLDQQQNQAIQAQLTEVIQQYSNELLEIYPKLVEQLTDLKISMNAQVYRPITSDRIDED